MSKRCFKRLRLLLTLGLLLLWMVGAVADTPAAPPVTVTITSPTEGSVVGGPAVRIEHRITHPKDFLLRAIETQVVEIGMPSLSLPLSASPWLEEDDTVILNTLPMHNGPCRITTRVVYIQGGQLSTVTSEPVTVTVKNLWITKASPATALFTVKLKQSQTVTVDFEHYQAAGSYRVEYLFRMPQSAEIIRKVVHERVTTHHDACTFTADRESFPWGAYICFDVKVSNGIDAATLLSPTCRVIIDDAEIIDDDKVSVVYALSEPPSHGGLIVLCYADLVFIAKSEGLSEQCRDWEHPVVIPFDATSFRSIYVGMDNHTDNRGRSPQPIPPES